MPYTDKQLQDHYIKLTKSYKKKFKDNLSAKLLTLHRDQIDFTQDLLELIPGKNELTKAVLQSSYQQYKEAILDIAEEIDFKYPNLNPDNAKKIAKQYLKDNEEDPNLTIIDINHAVNYVIKESQRIVMNKGDECLDCYDTLTAELGDQAPALFKKVRESTDPNEAIEAIQANENLSSFSKPEIIDAIIHKEFLDNHFLRGFDTVVDRRYEQKFQLHTTPLALLSQINIPKEGLTLEYIEKEFKDFFSQNKNNPALKEALQYKLIKLREQNKNNVDPRMTRATIEFYEKADQALENIRQDIKKQGLENGKKQTTRNNPTLKAIKAVSKTYKLKQGMKSNSSIKKGLSRAGKTFNILPSKKSTKDPRTKN